jgi:hypothetical protein
MKHFYLLCIAALFTISAVAQNRNVSEQRIANIIKTIAATNKANNDSSSINSIELLGTDFIDFNQFPNPKNHLKSATAKTQKLDSLLIERWNETTGQLEPSQLEKWTWDDKGLGKSWELYDLDSITKQWIPNDREEYEWDENGNKTIHTDFDRDSITDDWIINAKVNLAFDENGNRTNIIIQNIDRSTNEWINSSKQEFTYNARGKRTLELQYNWNINANQWVNYHKQETRFDTNGDETFLEVSKWNDTSGEWESEMFAKLEYDENRNTTYMELYIPMYFMHSKLEYSFDSNGNQTQTLSSE